jgi:hypothetical protein
VLELKPGKTAIFAVGFGETRYKITLKGITPVIKTRADSATVTKESEGG